MKFIKYLFLFLAISIWLAGLNEHVFKYFGSLHLFRDGYQFGDLYRLSNLPQFKDPAKDCPEYQPALEKPGNKKTNLFILGDSFTEPGRISKENFATDSYQYIRWSETAQLKLDTSANNILLIECVERHVREKFVAPVSNLKEGVTTQQTQTENLSFMQKLDKAFSSKTKEDRLDMLLFQNNVILAIKEWKAAFNYFFFDRVRDEVTLVNNGRDIVFYMDTDTIQNNRDPKTGAVVLKTTSSFTPLLDHEVDSIASNVKKSGILARKMGFDHVILSIIPNKVSVVMPAYGSYNNLIERVYADTSMTLPVIDVLPEFKSMGRSSYLLGDSHWTCAGQNIWLNKVNATIGQLLQSKQ